MRLGTFDDGTPDGQLVVVAADGRRALPAAGLAASLRQALQHWAAVAPELRALAQRLADDPQAGLPTEGRRWRAPLPQAAQWLDASAFENHGRWVRRAYGLPEPAAPRTLIYQGASDDFLGPHDDVPFVDEAHGIDFEAEIGVLLDEVPMGASPAQALAAVRLVLLLNDWSLRALQPAELASGFGFLQCKPATSFAPWALTPDELGPLWSEGRFLGRVQVWRGPHCIGRPSAAGMDRSFGELIAHAARTRRLHAGTLLGSGTVSDAAEGAGSATLVEVRAIEQCTLGAPRTGFLRDGERIRIESLADDGRSLFGALDQRVTLIPSPALEELT